MKTNRISFKGLTLIKRWEGVRLKPYLCPAGYWTVGYGHRMNKQEIAEMRTITKAEALELLIKDCRWVEKAILKYTKTCLTEEQFDAIGSFIFNLGSGNYRTSTLRKKINKGDWKGASEEFKRWIYHKNKSGRTVTSEGLIRRRRAESNVFIQNIM